MKSKNKTPKIGTNKRKSNKSVVDIIIDNQPLLFRQTNDNNNNNEQQHQKPQIQSDDENDWEDGSIASSSNFNNHTVSSRDFDVKIGDGNQVNGVTVEFDALPESSSKKKRVKRATAQDKEVAELVHKAHLLCLLARGRCVDAACDDPLIQAGLLSLLPSHFLKISEATKLTINVLTSLVSWFHKNFHVKSPSSSEKPFHSALACALANHGGSPEEVAALSVALLRALNLTTRFVSILDVASLKPEADDDKPSYLDRTQQKKDIFSSSTLMVSKMSKEGTSGKSSVSNTHEPSDTVQKSEQLADQTNNVPEEDDQPKRKGDLEFEMQLQMAMAATAVETRKRKAVEPTSWSLSLPSNLTFPLKIRRIAEESPSSIHVISTAIGSKKVGAPLHWAEVYCCGENMTGKWVHIDAVNAIIDAELKVESLAAACRRSLRYVVAFAGQGAKDVTRRYCAKWYKISPERVTSGWWDAVLFPLKELESRATNGMVHLHKPETPKGITGRNNSVLQACSAKKSIFPKRFDACVIENQETSTSSSSVYSRSTIEDMELATRELTEPLPTNQQAYRSHPLYAIEKWLTKYQILHPKGPVLGFCSGHAVYPRTCVQTLHTKERWLREGLQVRVDEIPSKVVKSVKNRRDQVVEVDDPTEVGAEAEVSLFGKWQTETLYLPHAVDGIVPKNERGQVDVWSEKCLPPGTMHLRLPRLVPVAKRLGIDFAPAMVGFEFRSGRSLPVYEGIVVCREFKEVILEAYAEEEQRREEEEKKRDERLAISRWYQLLSSMVTRQRLNDAYMNKEPESVIEDLRNVNNSALTGTAIMKESAALPVQGNTQQSKIHEAERTDTENHEHVFLTDDESLDEDSRAQTKRCRCGLFIQVEEL